MDILLEVIYLFTSIFMFMVLFALLLNTVFRHHTRQSCINNISLHVSMHQDQEIQCGVTGVNEHGGKHEGMINELHDALSSIVQLLMRYVH
jgi:hypothetical protein